MELHPDFRDLLAEFARENVRFLIIGGYAVGHYDRPRYTKDIDIWVGPPSENLEAAARALDAFGAPAEVVIALPNAQEDEIVWIGNPPLRIDFLRAIPGAQFEDAWLRRVAVNWAGVDVPLICLDDLIATKRAAGRERDLLDVKNLERVRKSQ